MMIAAGILLGALAIVIGLIWLTAGMDTPRYCECREGFTPNPHDGHCAVCRGMEPLKGPVEDARQETFDRTLEHNAILASIGSPNKMPLNQGRSAYLNGLTLQDNPRPKTDRSHFIWAEGFMGMETRAKMFPEGTRCHADRDGECGWIKCPQLLDGEPELSGRHCPLDKHEDED